MYQSVPGRKKRWGGERGTEGSRKEEKEVSRVFLANELLLHSSKMVLNHQQHWDYTSVNLKI